MILVFGTVVFEDDTSVDRLVALPQLMVSDVWARSRSEKIVRASRKNTQPVKEWLVKEIHSSVEGEMEIDRGLSYPSPWKRSREEVSR